MGEQVDGYEDLVDIGGGGFSRVYRARDLKHDRTVAIKVLDTRGATDSERRAFSRELKAMGGIGDHPHAVTVLESGFTSDDKPYLVMPFFEAGTFADKLHESGQLRVDEVLDLGVKIASTLETVHQLGYLHRDVKPENIFIGEFGGHALGDFGISSFTDGTTGTRTVGVALTPAHAAPEVWEDAKPTPLTDVYSLGSTLYNLLAGRPPFTADTHAGLLRKVLSEEPPRIGRDDVPRTLTQLLTAMLAKEPADRPASALAVAQSLHQVQVDQGLPATAVTVRAADTQQKQAPTAASVTPIDPNNVTIVRDPGIATTSPQAGELDSLADENAQQPNTPTSESVATTPERSAPLEPPAENATEVRSPLQQPVQSRQHTSAPGDISNEISPESSSTRTKPILIGIALLLAGGIAIALATRGSSAAIVTDDPADNAVQDVDTADIGPVLLANDPTDLRIELQDDRQLVRWEGPDNPNTAYEVMAAGAEEIIETNETELDLQESGLFVDGEPACISVRVTTIEPARVGEWVGPVCTGT